MKKGVLAVFLVLLSSAAVRAQTAFYEGKTIRMIVGFSPGGSNDLWTRLIAQHFGKYLPGNPEVVVQNLAGGGSMVAANQVYSIAKPDGLTLANIAPALYLEQLAGRQEAQFDWAKFTWIGSPERTDEVLFMRSDSPYKTIDDLRRVAEPARCGATGIGSVDHYFPKLLEDILGVKFNIVTGYPGAAEVHLAIEKGEMQCRVGSVSSFLDREPGRTWAKNGFVRVLVQGGKKRDPRLAEVPTVYEIMERYKSSNAVRGLANLLLAPGELGRPMVASPGLAADRVKLLRAAYAKTLSDPAVMAELKKRGWQSSPVSGEELAAVAKDAVSQAPEVVERMKQLLELGAK